MSLPPTAVLALTRSLAVAAMDRREQSTEATEPPERSRGSNSGILALAGLVGGLPLPPSPRPGSGRERHVRRQRARALAAELHLDVEAVYQALGRGETEEQIRR